MEPRTLQYMAEAAKGEQLTGPQDALVRRVCTDSRQAQADDLFVALPGECFDGHDFLEDVARSGIGGAVVERNRLHGRPNCPLIGVENSRLALGRIAARYRRDFQALIVAVAGSNGKTTTKDLLAGVLGQKFMTLASKASFNNDIGVPSTLLELTSEHQIAVLEFGTNHPGELAPLLRMAEPTLGILTSIGREHLEFFGDLNGVIQEEGCLAEALPAHGKLFINGDSPGVESIIRRCKAPVVRVGRGVRNDWQATQLTLNERGLCFTAVSGKHEFNRSFRVPLLGRHQAVNTLLTIAVAAELGLTADEVQRGLLTCGPAKMRLQVWNWNGVTVLDDSYNANADSVRAALDTLRDFPCTGRRIAVLGDMAELGVHSARAHEEIGSYAASLGLDHLVAVGKMASLTAQAARSAGLQSTEELKDTASAADALRRYLRPQDLVLLKASRAMALEKLGELLRAATPPAMAGQDSNQRRHRIGNG